MNTWSPAAEHVPKHSGKSTYEQELNDRECEHFNRNGRNGVLHRSPQMTAEVRLLNERRDQGNQTRGRGE